MAHRELKFGMLGNFSVDTMTVNDDPVSRVLWSVVCSRLRRSGPRNPWLRASLTTSEVTSSASIFGKETFVPSSLAVGSIFAWMNGYQSHERSRRVWRDTDHIIWSILWYGPFHMIWTISYNMDHMVWIISYDIVYFHSKLSKLTLSIDIQFRDVEVFKLFKEGLLLLKNQIVIQRWLKSLILSLIFNESGKTSANELSFHAFF